MLPLVFWQVLEDRTDGLPIAQYIGLGQQVDVTYIVEGSKTVKMFVRRPAPPRRSKENEGATPSERLKRAPEADPRPRPAENKKTRSRLASQGSQSRQWTGRDRAQRPGSSGAQAP